MCRFEFVKGFKIKLNELEFKIKPGTIIVSNSKNLIITETYDDGFCDVFNMKGLVSFKKHITDVIGKKSNIINSYTDITYFNDVFNSIKHLPSSYGGINVNAIHTPEVIGRIAKIKYSNPTDSEYINEYIGRINSIYSIKKITSTNYLLLDRNIFIAEKCIKDIEIY